MGRISNIYYVIFNILIILLRVSRITAISGHVNNWISIHSYYVG